MLADQDVVAIQSDLMETFLKEPLDKPTISKNDPPFGSQFLLLDSTTSYIKNPPRWSRMDVRGNSSYQDSYQLSHVGLTTYNAFDSTSLQYEHFKSTENKLNLTDNDSPYTTNSVYYPGSDGYTKEPSQIRQFSQSEHSSGIKRLKPSNSPEQERKSSNSNEYHSLNQQYSNNTSSPFFKGNFGHMQRVNPIMKTSYQNERQTSMNQKKNFFQIIQNPKYKSLPGQLKTLPTSGTKFVKLIQHGGQFQKKLIPFKSSRDNTVPTDSSIARRWNDCDRLLPPDVLPKSGVHSAELNKSSYYLKTPVPVRQNSLTICPTQEIKIPDIQLSPAAKDDPPATQVVATTIVASPVARNLIFGYKKLKNRCTACGSREATLNSLLTHVKVHRLCFCNVCAVIVATEKQLVAHMKKTHATKESRDSVTVTSKYGRRRHVLRSAMAQIKVTQKKARGRKTSLKEVSDPE